MTLPNVRPAQVALVEDGGATVLAITADNAAASALHRLDADASTRPRLAWRWKVDRVVRSADLTRKEGDDFAARVYVTFDVPLEALTFAQRTRVRLARLLHGTELPTAALCYVWDNRHPPGTSRWNPYSDQVRTVVLRSGDALSGRWMDEARDVAGDFREAFGERHPGPVPRITGVALSADTDQTGERVEARFGDVRLEAAR